MVITWIVYAALFAVYSLVRGVIVDWYPYPFLDPRANGYVSLVIGLVVLAVAMALMALAVNAVGRLGGRWRYGEAERDSVAM